MLTVKRIATSPCIVIRRSEFQKGFNLAEVMVAMSLITIALFALISIQIHAMRSQNGSRETHLASVIAASLLAEAEAKLEEDFDQDVSRADAALAEYPDFNALVKVEAKGPELKTVRVEVMWNKGPSVARRSVETTVAKAYY